MILERLPLRRLEPEEIETGLRFEAFAAETAFNQYERGRIFYKDGELRWEKIDQLFWTVFVGSDEITLPDIFTRDETLALAEPQSQTYYLWGKRLPNQALQILGHQKNEPVFAEFTVGGILTKYPADQPANEEQEHVALQVAQYIDPETKQMQYYRFQGVVWQ